MGRLIAITHSPSPRLEACERTFVDSAPIDHALAARQHSAFRQALALCGARVINLDVNASLPDSTFIEDTAVVLDEIAVLTPMGAASRRGESRAIEPYLAEHRKVARLETGTLEGGDVLRVGRTLLVGQSRRTSAAGIAAFARLLEPFGYRVLAVPVHGCLHLKTGCTALPDGRLLVNPNWIDVTALADFVWMPVPAAEPWGANVALLGEMVLMSSAHSGVLAMVSALGFPARGVDVSEFAKAEGGVTCLSLLFS